MSVQVQSLSKSVGGCPKFVQTLSDICLVIVNSQYLSSFCPEGAPFHEEPRSEVCPSFVPLQGNQVVSGKVKKSINCPEFVLHFFDELCQKNEDKNWTEGGFEDKNWI